MSSALEDNVEYSWTERLGDTWGHFAPQLLSVSIVAAIAVGLRPPTGALAVTMPIALLFFVVASWLLMRRHDRRLCAQCAASMPLNAVELSSRYRRRFWLAHAGSKPLLLIPYLVVLLGSNFAPGPYGRILWAVVQSSMIYLLASHSTHRRLQPWCPWCSNGGGGVREDSASPNPVLPDNRLLV